MSRPPRSPEIIPAGVTPERNLWRELAQHREAVATIQESLRSANAELEVKNEELQSANAELERKNEELQAVNRKLLTARERIEFLLMAAPTVIYSSRPSGDCAATFMSENVKAVLGYEAREFSGNPGFWQDRIHPGDRSRVAEGLERLAAGETLVIEYRFRHANGTYIWMRDECRLLLDPDGQPLEIVGSWIDVTGMREAEASRRASEEMLRQMMENIREVFWMMDAERARMLYVSPAYEGVWGRSVDSAYEDPGSWAAAIHEDDRERVIADFYSQPMDDTFRFDAEYRVVRPDGSVRWIRDRGFPIRGEQEEIYRLAGLAEDITDRKEAEEKLLRYQAELRSLTAEVILTEERERRKLASDLHDGLGQTLTLIELKLKQLAGGDGIEEDLHDLRQLAEQANQTARSLTFQLSPPVLHDLGFEAAIQWLVEDMQNSYGLDVALEERGGHGAMNERERVILFRAVRELLINVVKHAQTRQAWVSIGRRDGHLKVVVEDHGVGLGDPAQAIHRGTGLFSIRERLVQIGGRMEARSRGKGTRITLVIPPIGD